MSASSFVLHTFRQQCIATLQPVCISHAQAVAETDWIFQHILEISAEQVWVHLETPVTQQALNQVETLLKRRVQERQPVQYLLGEAYFYGQRFQVTPAVLIPRPETELLVQAVLQYVGTRPQNQPIRILELGTGSGCIAITLAIMCRAKNQAVELMATDISSAALAVALQNAQNHQVDSTIQFLESNWFKAISPQAFDVIVSNPPYIATDLATTLQPEVVNHEPHLALFSGEVGLDSYRAIAAGATDYLTLEGQLFLEIGAGMRQSVQCEFEAQNWQLVDVVSDLEELERIVVFAK